MPFFMVYQKPFEMFRFNKKHKNILWQSFYVSRGIVIHQQFESH